jgi:hypothetical protein
MEDKLNILAAIRLQNNQNLANMETKLHKFKQTFQLNQSQINCRDLIAELECYKQTLKENEVALSNTGRIGSRYEPV